MLNINKELILDKIRKNKHLVCNRITIPSLLSKTLKVEGNLFSEGTVEIEGQIRGNIKGDIVTLRENANVEGDIRANIVNIKGYFKGQIFAEKVNISREARIFGNIQYFSLTVEDGASIEGQFKRVKNKDTMKVVFLPKTTEKA